MKRLLKQLGHKLQAAQPVAPFGTGLVMSLSFALLAVAFVFGPAVTDWAKAQTTPAPGIHFITPPKYDPLDDPGLEYPADQILEVKVLLAGEGYANYEDAGFNLSPHLYSLATPNEFIPPPEWISSTPIDDEIIGELQRVLTFNWLIPAELVGSVRQLVLSLQPSGLGFSTAFNGYSQPFTIVEFMPPAVKNATLRLVGPTDPIAVDETFEVNLYLDLADHKSGGADFKITYDPTYLTFVSFGGLAVSGANESPTGTITGFSFAPLPGSPLTGDNNLIGTLSFTAIAPTPFGQPTPIEFAMSGNSVKNYPDGEEILGFTLGTTVTVTVAGATPPAIPANGFYTTEVLPFDFEGASNSLQSLGIFTAGFAADNQTGQSGVRFWIRFLDANDNPLGGGAGFDTEQFYVITPDADLNMIFSQYVWFADIQSVQFKAELWTEDYYNVIQPELYSLQLTYSVNMTQQVVVINFEPEDTPTHQMLVKGESATIGFTATPLNFSGAFQIIPTGILANANITVTMVPTNFRVDLPGEGTNGAANFTLTFATSASSVSGVYEVKIGGHALGEDWLIATPALLTLEVVDTLPPPEGDFILSLPVSEKTGAPGSEVNFAVNINRRNNFTEDITFAATGGLPGTWALFNPNPSRMTDTNLGTAVELRIQIPASAPAQVINFNVMGTSLSTNKTYSIPAILRVVITGEDKPAITVNVTVPVEERPAHEEPGQHYTAQPTFTLRLYAGLSQTHETTFKTTATNTAAVAIPAGIVEVGKTYTPYFRTDRHLWVKGDAFMVTANSATYTVVIPTRLLAGDIVRDDIGGSFTSQINSLDHTEWVKEVFKTADELGKTFLISDFNNDGVVNTADLQFILNNWFKSAILPN